MTYSLEKLKARSEAKGSSRLQLALNDKDEFRGQTKLLLWTIGEQENEIFKKKRVGGEKKQ